MAGRNVQLQMPTDVTIHCGMHGVWGGTGRWQAVAGTARQAGRYRRHNVGQGRPVRERSRRQVFPPSSEAHTPLPHDHPLSMRLRFSSLLRV